MWDECDCAVVWAFFCIAFLRDYKENWPFPVATAEFSKFAGRLSAALSQHHLLGSEIALLEFHHLHWLLFTVMVPNSCYLLLISSASVRSIPFLSFIEPIFAWNVPLVSLIFLKRSLVFPILFFSSISLHWSLRKAFLSLLIFFGTLHSDGYILPFLICC